MQAVLDQRRGGTATKSNPAYCSRDVQIATPMTRAYLLLGRPGMDARSWALEIFSLNNFRGSWCIRENSEIKSHEI